MVATPPITPPAMAPTLGGELSELALAVGVGSAGAQYALWHSPQLLGMENWHCSVGKQVGQTSFLSEQSAQPSFALLESRSSKETSRIVLVGEAVR